MNENPERDRGETLGTPKPAEAPVPPVAAKPEVEAKPVPPAGGAASGAKPAMRQPAMQPRSAPAVLTLVGLVLLAGGFVWLAVQMGEMRAAMSQPGVDPGQVAVLEQRVAALEKRPAGDTRALEARIAALERRPAGAPVDLGAVEGRIAALEQRPVAPPMDPRVDALSARLDRLISASTALAAEEAALRLDYPAAARAAAAASKPARDGLPFMQRVWAEVSTLVTVKEGDVVLSGPPAAPALERARVLVSVGDFAGAVKALDGLDPGAAAAMAAWRGRAEKAAAARAALAKVSG